MIRLLLPLFCLFALAAPAGAQALSDDYRALLEDAATYEDGAHFDATARLVARSAPGGAEAVADALAATPDLAARARAALGLPAVAPVATAAAEAGAASPAAGTASATTAAPERGFFGGLAHALTHEDGGGVWSGKVRLGLQWDSGNTDQQDYTLGLEVERALVGWGFKGAFDYAYTKSGGAVSRNQLSGDLRGERDIGDRWSVYGVTAVERDTLASWRTSAFVGAGVGYRISATDSLTWAVRGAPGVQFREPAAGSWQTQLAAELSSEIDWTIAPNVEFDFDTSLTVSDATRAEQTFSLSTNVAGGWGAQTSLRYRYDFDPLPGFRHADSRLTVSLLKTF